MQLFLMLLALVASASGLRVCVHSTRPEVARSAAARMMAFPKFEDARSLSTDEIESEIATAKKELFELRKKVKTRQQVKPHLFKMLKHRIGQLQTLLSQRAA